MGGWARELGLSASGHAGVEQKLGLEFYAALAKKGTAVLRPHGKKNHAGHRFAASGVV